MPAFSSLSIPELVTIGGFAAPRKDGKTAAPDCPVTATFGAAGSALTSILAASVTIESEGP